MEFEICVGEKFKYANDVPIISLLDSYGNEHSFNVRELNVDVVDSFMSTLGINYKLRFSDGRKTIYGWYKQEELLAGLEQGIIKSANNPVTN